MSDSKYNSNELPPLTPLQQEELARMAKLSDDNIDLSDIPEVTDWSGAQRGGINKK
ncbi:hypothetical protein [uncultured Psychrobacter sp.]|uniref:hypothetical protein n=1 Tax=uncultured Psychrobacter sp. TaxID=259303 RepID=UPI0030D7F0E0